MKYNKFKVGDILKHYITERLSVIFHVDDEKWMKVVILTEPNKFGHIDNSISNWSTINCTLADLNELRNK